MGERCIIKYALCTRKNNYNDFDIKAVRFYVISISTLDAFAQKQVQLSQVLIAFNETIKFEMNEVRAESSMNGLHFYN